VTGAAQQPGNFWIERVRNAEQVIADYERFANEFDEISTARAASFTATLDPQALVSSRHHVVPRFILERWANPSDQVQVYRRIERRYTVNNIADLAIRDFYTFFDTDGRKNSSLESLLGIVEDAAAEVIRRLLSPFGKSEPFRAGDRESLAQFAAFQSVRSPRQRREYELMVDWMSKSHAIGHLSDDQLRAIEILPHQNESLANLGKQSEALFPLFAARPLALITLDKPLLFLGDDPIVIDESDSVQHSKDCFLTDQEIKERLRRRRRKDRKKPLADRAGRVVHLWTTAGRGVGVAREIVMPICPRAVLWWGPLGDRPALGGLVRDHLVGSESREFANQVNEAICARALDWIISRPDDETFSTLIVPELGPLIVVCDGVNVASEAANSVPRHYRPRRLSSPGSPER
jgi:hypothetical protein